MEKLRKVIEVPISTIWLSPLAVRGAVFERRPSLVESIRKHGIRTKPLCRPANKDKAPAGKVLELCYGCQRTKIKEFLAIEELKKAYPDWTEEKLLEEAGKTLIHVEVADLNDEEFMSAQIDENKERIQQTSKETRQAIVRYAVTHPGASLEEIGDFFNEDATYIEKVMNIEDKLSPKLQELLDKKKSVARTELSFTLANELSKLPYETQEALIEADLLKLPVDQQMAKIKVEINAFKKGQKSKVNEFILPAPKWIGLRAYEEKLTALTAAGRYEIIEGLKLACGQDDESIKNARLEWEGKQAKKAEKSKVKSLEEENAALQAKIMALEGAH